jgi:hypothetical protein
MSLTARRRILLGLIGTLYLLVLKFRFAGVRFGLLDVGGTRGP